MKSNEMTSHCNWIFHLITHLQQCVITAEQIRECSVKWLFKYIIH